MPRSGSGIYSKPAGTTAVPNTTITSSQFNTTIDDIAADLNYPRPIVNGGTGATSASAARTALGLEIGVNIQAYDAGLQSISGLVTSENQMIYTTASDVFAATSLTPFSRTILDDADASTMRETLGANDASNLTDGTLNDDRLSGDYSFGSLTLSGGLTLGTSLAVANGGTGATTVEAARANLEVYSKGEIDTRWAEQGNAPIDASRLTTGTIPELRLPLSLQPLAQANVITDCNEASRNGWYAIESSGANKPSSLGGYVFTIAKHTDWWVQYFFTQSEDANNQRRWRRFRAGSTWGSWGRIYEAEAELQALIDAQIAATVPASTSPNVHIFTSSGTYTKSSGLKWAKITVIGGGGGGASGTATGNGGGGGGTAIKYASASEIGETNSVIVGAGGNAGSGGGISSINLGSVTVTGGGGGVGGGGAATNGTLNISGGNGLSYYCGGSTIFPGGGGGGASSGAANTGCGGGSGRPGGSGVVIVEEYF